MDEADAGGEEREEGEDEAGGGGYSGNGKVGGVIEKLSRISGYSKAMLSSNGVQGSEVIPNFIRLMVEHGFNENTIIGGDNVNGEIS